ncbi:MAG: TIGR04282 family arsenosugar biosynthesis glycosyltransferase [Parvularculaceae bacterium]|nr:TIGR04282 family arsenosugar biosynthesis glycosyltransferase [Parvularculaceae bacterium]
MRGTLIIIVKAPVAGRVKTRLGAALGPARAAAMFRVLSANTLSRASAGPWRTVLAVDPPGAVAGFENLWPPRFSRIAQMRGDLGARMAAAFALAPPGPVVIIGADAPGVSARHIRAAFAALAGCDAVFGPAEDGGYWLIGLSRRRAVPRLLGGGLFKNVRWSSPHALADTLAGLPARFRVAMIERLRDLDDGEDFAALGARALRRVRPSVAGGGENA